MEIKKIKSRKSQSETVGFIVIVLMVMIVGVIFLGISLRKQPTAIATDAEISNFLITSGKYTTDCAKDYEPNYRDLQEVIADCYQNKLCLDERNTCFVLNKTLSEMLKNFRPSGKVLSYYRASFYYTENISDSSESRKTIFGNEISSGEASSCISKKAGRNYINLASGYAVEELEVCLED
jgi:hypothetical protein